jgi:lipid II:glycine glycyltransferase (peptidoglycan interpeptide bridge formation enzyme)
MTSNKFKFEKIDYSNVDRWNQLLYKSELASYRNSFEYEYSRNAGIRKTQSFILSRNNEDIAGIHYTSKSVLFGFLKVADLLSGILFKYSPDSYIIDLILQHFISWAKDNNSSYIRFTPWIAEFHSLNSPNLISSIKKTIKKNCMEEIKPSTHTYWIDLSLKEEILLKKMKATTRRKIKNGMISNIVIDIIENNDNEVIEEFWKLYHKLGARKGFNQMSKNIFIREVKTLISAKQAVIFILKFQNVIINISLASNFGTAMYYHGAVNHEYKALKGCPSPGHLAQWQMIRYLKSKGLKYYDMAFCPGPEPYKEHPMFDMWRFKHSFGGIPIKYLPTYGKTIQPIRGKIFEIIKLR